MTLNICLLISLQLAEVEKQQLLKQQQNQKNSKTVRELERINRVSLARYWLKKAWQLGTIVTNIIAVALFGLSSLSCYESNTKSFYATGKT